MRADKTGERRRADKRPVVSVGIGEFEQRVVGESGERQRRDVAQEVAARHARAAIEDGPFALAHAQRDVVLNDLVVAGEFETLTQRVLGRAVLFEALEQTACILQRHDLVLEGLARDRSQLGRHAHPLQDSLSGQTHLLENETEAQTRLREVGAQAH